MKSQELMEKFSWPIVDNKNDTVTLEAIYNEIVMDLLNEVRRLEKSRNISFIRAQMSIIHEVNGLYLAFVRKFKSRYNSIILDENLFLSRLKDSVLDKYSKFYTVPETIKRDTTVKCTLLHTDTGVYKLLSRYDANLKLYRWSPEECYKFCNNQYNIKGSDWKECQSRLIKLYGERISVSDISFNKNWYADIDNYESTEEVIPLSDASLRDKTPMKYPGKKVIDNIHEICNMIKDNILFTVNKAKVNEDESVTIYVKYNGCNQSYSHNLYNLYKDLRTVIYDTENIIIKRKRTLFSFVTYLLDLFA